jgi:hypothetical protein
MIRSTFRTTSARRCGAKPAPRRKTSAIRPKAVVQPTPDPNQQATALQVGPRDRRKKTQGVIWPSIRPRSAALFCPASTRSRLLRGRLCRSSDPNWRSLVGRRKSRWEHDESCGMESTPRMRERRASGQSARGTRSHCRTSVASRGALDESNRHANANHFCELTTLIGPEPLEPSLQCGGLIRLPKV